MTSILLSGMWYFSWMMRLVASETAMILSANMRPSYSISWMRGLPICIPARSYSVAWTWATRGRWYCFLARTPAS